MLIKFKHKTFNYHMINMDDLQGQDENKCGNLFLEFITKSELKLVLNSYLNFSKLNK